MRLDGPDTTVDQLLAAASQAGPSLPAAGLAPRPRPAALQQPEGAAALATAALRCPDPGFRTRRPSRPWPPRVHQGFT